MKPAKPYLLGFWVMAVITVIKLIVIISSYIYIRQRGIERVDYNWANFGVSFIIALEVFVYWYRRYKIPNKLWVHIHAWTSVVATIVLPAIMTMAFNMLMREYYQHLPDETKYLSDTGYLVEYTAKIRRLTIIQLYVFWGLLLIGHAFFIATIVKSFSPMATGLNEESESDEPPGLLDEFVNRR